jgi:hypothetical protein
LLQAAGSPLWHSPPGPLQLAVVIDTLPEEYVLSPIGGGVGVTGSACVRPSGALANKSVSVTMVVNKNVTEVMRAARDENNFFIMRFNLKG